MTVDLNWKYNLNTSHVNVNQVYTKMMLLVAHYLNTSHVNVNR